MSRRHGGEGHTYCCELSGVPSYQLQLPADNQYLLNTLAASHADNVYLYKEVMVCLLQLRVSD